MKKNIIIFLLSMLVVSCELQLTPTTEWTGRNFPTEESQLYGLLYGGYKEIQSALGINFLHFGEMRADAFQMNAFSVNNDKIISNKLDNGMSITSWLPFYKIVQQANLVIKFTNDAIVDGYISEETSKDLLGQAYTMRAFSYFYINRIWGDAPLILEPYLYADDDINIGRTDKSVIFTQIHEDLNNGIDLLSNNYKKPTTFSKNAAYAIKAHAHAWQHDYDSVIIIADKLLSNNDLRLESLYSTSIDVTSSNFTEYVESTPYSDIFNKGNSRESIFEIAYDIGGGDDSRSLSSYLSSSYPFIRPRIPFIESFNEELDWRYHQALKRNTSTSYTAKKFTINFQNDVDSRNIVLYRLSDIYLLKAEATLQLGDSDADRINAMELVNTIRNRAGGPDFTIPEEEFLDRELYTRELIQNVVLNERKLELCFEGHRWFDLIRNNKVVEVLKAEKGIDLDIRSIVWPIHLEEIRRSKLIEQNEYYK